MKTFVSFSFVLAVLLFMGCQTPSVETETSSVPVEKKVTLDTNSTQEPSVEPPVVEESLEAERIETEAIVPEIELQMDSEEGVSLEVRADAEKTPLVMITETTAVEELLGNPSVVVFGGTYCPHCKTAVPVFKTDIWDAYKDSVHIWVNVIDQKKFDVADIPQGFNENFTFERFAKKDCAYVPSWVVLDAEMNPVLTSCGGDASLSDMKQKLDELLS